MLTNNKASADLSALSQLHELGSLILVRNPELQSLEGLKGLRRARSLTVINNGLVSREARKNLDRRERHDSRGNPHWSGYVARSIS